MSDVFDPYHKWLGIPPEEQPADHYRLLGLRPFESDPEVIEHAAYQRMSHLRTLQQSQHHAVSEKLLNELSSALRCLLHEESKAAYDTELRSRNQTSPRPAPAPSDFLPPTRPSPPVEREAPRIPASPDSPLATAAPTVPLAGTTADASTGTGAKTVARPAPAMLDALAPVVAHRVEEAPPEPPVPQVPATPAVVPVAAPEAADGTEESEEDWEPSGGLAGQWFRSFSAMMLSGIVHLVLFIILALWLLPDHAKLQLENLMVLDLQPPSSDELITAQAFEIESDTALSIARSDPLAGLASSISDTSVNTELLETSFNYREHMSPFALNGPKFDGTDLENILGEIKVGGLGDAHAVVDDYQEALDRITQEILMMLDEKKLLLVWLFDQSASMKDDQQEIRDRIDNIYGELAGEDRATGDAIETAVTSFGSGFMLNTPGPTRDAVTLQRAIDTIPDDPSGEEMMCQAVLRVLALYNEYAKVHDRQLAIIVVTDEAGEPKDNRVYLEAAIAQAKASNCRVFVLGREAAFGTLKAQMRWVHPLNGDEYWLPVDRGPESAFVEQLQTDGFGKRVDVHPSGFGPYGQCRLARETGGVFFMLPSQEVNLVRGESRRYELRILKDYRPDLRARAAVGEQIANDRLQLVLTKVINDLNPYREEVADITEVRRKYSAKPNEFIKQVAKEETKARKYLTYLNRAIQELEAIRPLRDEEESRRWRANYDLAFAQLLAYAARTYEYIATIDDFAKNPEALPLTKATSDGRPGHLELTHWDVELTEDVVDRELTRELVERSSEAFQALIEEHAGTPWAARAEWELKRGFGVRLKENYRYRAPPKPKRPKPAGRPNRGNAGGKRRPKPPAPKPAAPTIVIPKAL